MSLIINSYQFTAAGYDSDAQAFFTATGMSDSTQKTAINQLVLDLKSASIWTKIKGLYPFVGGTAGIHKYNLKDPRDLDAAFRIDFFGGITHDSTGADPNGTNAYGKTHLNANTLTGAHLFKASAENTNTSTDEIDLGGTDGSNYLWLSCYYHAYGLDADLSRNTSGSVLLTGTNATSAGNFGTTKTGTTSKLIKNGTTQDTQTDTGSNPNIELYIFAYNSTGSDTFYTNRKTQGISIGDGLTATEMGNLMTAFSNMNSTLGR